MADASPDRIKISIEMSPTLIALFDKACKSEFGEGDKRSLKIRTLMREYIERQGV